MNAAEDILHKTVKFFILHPSDISEYFANKAIPYTCYVTKIFNTYFLQGIEKTMQKFRNLKCSPQGRPNA